MIGTGKRRAVFLDRDGTIIEDVPYLFEPEKVVLIKGAAQAIKMLNRLGFQSGGCNKSVRCEKGIF